MSLKKLMAGLMLCPCFNTLFAASPSYTGIVKDEAGIPVEFANVTLLALNDSTFVDGTVTDQTGKFAISSREIPVFLKISFMGYEDKIIDNPEENLGDIILTPVSYTLGEVVVKGSRPMAKLKGDGVQVPISGTYLANTGTALEVLGKMPFVTKNGSDVEVLGKGTPLIYINGRQVRDMSELDQLASTQIKNVDVVTNPGARYDSNVNSVIRITTVAPVGEGFSFNDRTTIGYKHYAYLFEQVNFNWRKNGFDLFGMLNYENYRERPGISNATTQYFKSGIVWQNSFGKDFAKYPIYQGKIGLNYTATSHYFGLYYDFSFKPSTLTGSSLTDRYVNDVFSETLENISETNRYDRQHLVSAYYSGKIGNFNLSANFDALWQNNDSHSAENEVSSTNEERKFLTFNDVCNRLLAGNITALTPLWKGEFRFGTEINNIRRTDRYTGNTNFISDSDIKIDETTSALFAETDQTFGIVSAGVGIRWEYTDSKYWQEGKLSDDQSRRYHNLAPSANISFLIGNVRTNISYMRKTTRPAFAQLSSAVRYIDRYSYESGNPNLKPIYRDYVSASLSWKDLVVELEYYSTKNYFMWQTSEYPGVDDVTLLTMVNMPRFHTYGAYLNYSPTFFGLWHPSFMAGIDIQDFKLTHAEQIINLNKPLGIFRFNNAIHLPWDIWLNADFSARTSGNGDNFYMKSYWQCNLGLYKSFAHDTWSVKLQLNDVFDTWRQDIISYDALSSTAVKKIFDTRDLSLTIRYNFNSARSRYKGRGAGNSDKNRF
ncbi:MAG: outer membrane beta-barrel protein [Muribaculaceae bacterium]|nr:outer membrane beta-barrel protein [Muribaculaceae bacterium]